MPEAITFADLEQANYTAPKKPFFAIDLSNEDEVFNWLKEELMQIRRDRTQFLDNFQRNYLRYKGYQYLNEVYYPRDTLVVQKKYQPNVVLPLISDAIDEKTSRILEMKPAVIPIPIHDEQKDKIDTKMAKRFLQHLDIVDDMDGSYQKILRSSQIAGESFLWTRWNPDKGEELAELKQLSTEEGNPVLEGVFEGDVETVHKTANWVFYEKAESWDKVNYCFIVELDYVEALKLEYPHKKDQITEDAEATVFDFHAMEKVAVAGKCRKITFYHRKTKYMAKGYEACFTTSAFLKGGPLSYKHGELPIDRLIDVENDEEVSGQSSIDKTKGVASTVNNILNSVIKMFMLAGYAKWFVEAGSVDTKQLNNDTNIVNIKAGSKSPVLAQANPVGQGHFTFLDTMKGWFYDFMKSNSVVRGEPPPGVTAGVALQYVSESEARRMRTSVSNFNTLVRNVQQKRLDTASQFYLPTDKRTLMVLGKDNRWEQYPLDISSIAKPYSIMIQNTSGLADSKAMRTQQVLDVNKEFPGVVPREQVLEMTGLAQSDKFYDVGSAAVRAAEDENEWIQDGKGQIEPQAYEDLIRHWQIHVQSIQPMGFKQKSGEKIYNDMIDHITATEMLIMEKAMINPIFKEQVAAQCPQFPLFMEMPIMPPAMPIAPTEIPAENLPPQGDLGVPIEEPIPQEMATQEPDLQDMY